MSREMLKLEAPIHLYVEGNNFAFDYKGELAIMDLGSGQFRIEGPEAAKAFAYGLCVGLQADQVQPFLERIPFEAMIILAFTGMVASYRENGLDQNRRATIPAHTKAVWLLPQVKAYMAEKGCVLN